MPNGGDNGLLASVVVVAYLQEHGLQACLPALASQSLARDRYEIIVVDNGGNGAAKQATAGLWDSWLETGSNLGCSGGRNFGAKACRADVVFFIDDDGVVNRGFLASGLAALTSDPTVVAVRGKIVPKEQWLLTTLLDGVGDLGPEPGRNVGYELEGASCVRRADFDAVGGFDERLAGGEGRDFIVRTRLQRPEATVLYEPAMELAHDYVRDFGHFLYKARRAAIAKDRWLQGAAMPTYNPPPGTFDLPPWRPPLWLRAARRALGHAMPYIGALPYRVREAR